MSETLFMFGPKYKWLRLTGVAVIIAGLVAGFFLYATRNTGPIVDFNYDRDTQLIRDNFQKEWTWLVSDETDLVPDDIEILMRTGHIEKRGWRSDEPATIKVLLDNEKPQAFIVFYHQRAYRGYIQFLGVAPEARGKGYGKTLIKYALTDLFSRGCEYIYLTAKLSNEPARHIYESVGFKEHHRDAKYIEYRLFKKDYKA